MDIPPPNADVLGVRVHALSWASAIELIAAWASRREARYVCLCNVHSVVTAGRDTTLLDAINGADLATPDGMPVAWLLRRAGHCGQERIDGPDLMWNLCATAEERGLSVFLYGSTADTLARLTANLLQQFPRLRLAGMHAPPFRPLTEQETAQMVERIRSAQPHLVFVGLGCPKQELWMSANRSQLQAVLLGVGAAFDFHAARVRRAPPWMRRAGLEWCFRLLSEPRRLWKRYLITNSLFMVRVARRLLFGSTNA